MTMYPAICYSGTRSQPWISLSPPLSPHLGCSQFYTSHHSAGRRQASCPHDQNEVSSTCSIPAGGVMDTHLTLERSKIHSTPSNSKLFLSILTATRRCTENRRTAVSEAYTKKGLSDWGGLHSWHHKQENGRDQTRQVTCPGTPWLGRKAQVGAGTPDHGLSLQHTCRHPDWPPLLLTVENRPGSCSHPFLLLSAPNFISESGRLQKPHSSHCTFSGRTSSQSFLTPTIPDPPSPFWPCGVCTAAGKKEGQ